MQQFGGGRMTEGPMGSLLMMLLGSNMWPLAGRNQSQTDALWQRQHTMDMMQVGRNAVANAFPLRNLGFNGQSIPGQMVTQMLSSPGGGPMMNLFSPILGGNPVLAQQSTFASMQGFNMAGLGTLRGLSMSELSSATDKFNQGFYNTRLQTAAEQRQKMLNNDGFRQSMQNVGYDMGDMTGPAATPTAQLRRIAEKGQQLDSYVADLGKGGFDQSAIMAKLQNFGVKDTSGDLAKKIEEAVKKGAKEGNKDTASTIAKAINENKSVTSIRDAAQQSAQYISTQDRQITTGVNLRRSMGFAQEDIYGFTNEAIKNRLIQGKNYGDVLKIFSGDETNANPTDAMRAMDAARGFFGRDLSGKQLAQSVSDFIGTSNVNLASNPNILTNTFSGLRALSRTGNMDLDQIKGLVAQVQQATSLGGATGYFGGIEASDIVQKAAASAGSISTINTPEMSQFIRMQGGSATMTQNYAKGQVISANEPISYQLAALYHSYNGNKAVQASIKNYAQNANGQQLTDIGFQNFMRTLPGNAIANLQYAETNKTAQALGFQEGTAAGIDFGGLGGKSATAAAFTRLKYTLGNGQMAQKAINRGMAMLQKGDVNGFLSDRELMVSGDIYNTFSSLATQGFLNDYNPQAVAAKKEFQKQQAINAEYERRVAVDMGHMNAPALTRFTQAIISGEGLEGLANAVGISKTGSMYSQAFAAQKSIRNIKGSKNLNDALGSGGAGWLKPQIDEINTGIKFKLTKAQLSQLKEGGNLDDVLSKDQLSGTSEQDKLSIRALAKDHQLYDNLGDGDTLTDATARQNAVSDQINRVIDQSSAAQTLIKTADESLLGTKDNRPDADSLNQNSILNQYGGQNFLKMLASGGTDAEAIYKKYQKYAEESQGGVTQDAGGKFGLGEEHTALLKLQNPDAKTSFNSREEAEAALKGLDQASLESSGMGMSLKSWATAHGEAKNQIDTVKNAANASANLANLPELVQHLVTAINNVSAAINGTPTAPIK